MAGVSLGAVVLAALLLLNLGVATGGGGGSSAGPARVLGFVVASVSKQQQIFVPNVHVLLKNAAGRRLATVRTDLSGRFEFAAVKSGRVRVCWEGSGFVSDCTAPFPVRGFDRYLGTRVIRVRPGSVTFFGRARFTDGSTPRTWEPMENVNAFATVTAIARGGARLAPDAHVNNYGDYILAGVPARTSTFLRAVIERTRTVVPSAKTSRGTFRRLDLVLPNLPPKIAGLVADTGGGNHWSAAPGARVTVNAVTQDPNGDPVTVRWTLPDGTSPPSPSGSHTTSFTLPNRAGVFEFHAVAYDGKGGYATDAVSISTHGIRFSGLVRATNAPFVPGAFVEIGGRTATTDANGRFELVVDEAPRYVINIGKAGYMPVSSVSDMGVIGGDWTLTRASVVAADPTQTIDVTNQRIPSDCPGSLSSQVAAKGKQGQCGPGIRVVIPANSLIGSNGLPPSGPVSIALATVDPGAPDQMPGDSSAVDANGNTARIVSFGGGFVEITAGPVSYNLKPGATATVTIPIAPTQLASGTPAPTSIPLLTYAVPARSVSQQVSAFPNAKGVWTSEGTATRSGNAYVATVQHFSFIGLDVTRTDPACIRLDAVGMPQRFDLQVTAHDEASGAPIVRTVLFENSGVRFHLIEALPPNDADVEIRAFVPGTGTPILLALPSPTPAATVLTANSGPPSTSSPPFPYTVCQGFSGAKPGPLPSAVLVQATVPQNVVDEFLNFGAGAENVTAKPAAKGPWEAQAGRYYDTIDPLHLRLNVGDFRVRNQFGSGEVLAAYANSADLGFGREMHCQRHTVAGLAGFDVACYVTNYGNKDTDDFDDFVQALTALNSPDKVGAVATVGMEYSRIENPSDPTGKTFVSNTRVVKFYVWGGPPAATGDQLAPSANLDGFGARPVPQLCQECHGGHFTGVSKAGVPRWKATTANLHSNFIAFDLRGLTLPTYLGVDYKATQQAAFKALNTDIVLSAQPGRAVRAMIASMYPAGSSTQNENSETVGWRSTAGSPSPYAFYRDVIAASCRTCHYSQDTSVRGSPTRTFNDWDQASELAKIAGTTAAFVCQQQVMPHALITHRRFWLVQPPDQPRLLHDFLRAHGASATAVKTCR